MDLKRLHNFLRIAEAGSLSRASDRTRVAQPVLSRQMQLLEEEIGVPLFVRHRRGMYLTEAGEELQRRLVGPLRQIEQAVEDVCTLSTEASGHIAFGMPPTVSYVLASRLARRVAEQAPNVSLRIVEGYTGHLIDWLQRGEIDISILYGPASDLHMKVEELVREQLMLIGPPSCELDPAKPVTVAEMTKLPLVLPSSSHGLRAMVENGARRIKGKLNIRFEADSFVVLKELVESGLGYTVLPLSAFSREADNGKLRYAPLSKPPLMRQLVMAGQDDTGLSRATRIVRQLVRDEITALVQGGEWQAQLLMPQHS